MANYISIKAVNNRVYSGFDVVTAQQWCTPSILGCNGCISADTQGGNVVLTISLNTPVGNVSKSFTIQGRTSFTWQPFSRVKIVITISNFTNNGQICFDLSGQLCFLIPIKGWTCVNLSHTFCIPSYQAASKALSLQPFNNLNDTEFSSQLALLHLLEQNNKCNCH